MRFAHPEFLLLMLALPLIFWLSLFNSQRLIYSNTDKLKRSSPHNFNPRVLLNALRIVTLGLCILGLARPQSGKVSSEILSEGVDIFLALDTSGSMQAMDFKKNNEPISRLEIVKNVAARFVTQRKQDRIGLVVFGEEAYTQCPLTLDHGVVVDFLERLEIGMAGDMTAVGSGLATAVNRMKDLKAQSKVVILMTDGRNNTGRIDPETATQIAQTYGIKVYSIGIGTLGKAPFLVDTLFGKQFVYQDVDLDEGTLQKISHSTGGKYYRATDTKKLEEIYDEIDQLEKSEVKVKEYTEYNELFSYFLLAALIFLGTELILSQTRLRILP